MMGVTLRTCAVAPLAAARRRLPRVGAQQRVPVSAAAASSGSSDSKEVFVGASQMKMGEAPPENFFRDIVYKKAKAEGRQVPWDLEAPQPDLKYAQDRFKGRVLDVGCGTGDNSIWVAGLPGVSSVSSVDISPDAIEICRERLAKAKPKAPVTFLLGDVFDLPPDWREFDCLLDSAVFHCIGDDDAQRKYLAAVTQRVKVGGSVVMLVFSDLNPDPWVGPRRISEAHARKMWTEAGWNIETLRTDVFSGDRFSRNDGRGGNALLMVATRAR